jgi:hypothetical protein
LLVGLPPGRRYAVTPGARATISPARDGAFTTDARGVLRFELAGGAARPLPASDDGRLVSSAP